MTAERKSKTIACKFGKFDFMTNNHVAAIIDKDEVPREFHLKMDFLMAGPLNHALTSSPIINMDGVTHAWTLAMVVDSILGQPGKISIQLGNDTFDITSSVINSILNLYVKT